MLYIGADHAGFELKNYIKQYFKDKNVEFKDLGADSFDLDDDFTDYAFKVAEMVANSPDMPNSYGILVCRNGVGVGIAANKVKKIRAVTTNDLQIAITSREDDDTNVLCIPADYILFDDALNLIEQWLKTEFLPNPKYKRRLDKITAYETK